MKVLLFLPFPHDSPTGNAVTARRIARNLAPRGVDVSTSYLPPEATLDAVEGAIARVGPDVLMWYHAWKTARWLPQVRVSRALPSVITLTGTDINRDAVGPQTRDAVVRALRAADAVVTYSAALRDHAVALLPEISQRVHVIPKGVDLGTEEFDPPAWMKGDTLLFLLPAGVRPEKNNRFAVRALDALHAEEPRVRLLLAGPVLDPQYAAALREDLASRPWAGHIQAIPHAQMASVFSRSAVVLNTSLSEGLANSVLEGMACGRPVLASDVEGNRQVVEPDVSGLLYSDEADFVAKARLLASDPALRERLGSAARRRIEERHSAGAEGDELAFLLRRLERRCLDPRDARLSARRLAMAPVFDPRGLPSEIFAYDRVGRIEQASSDRVRADHATDLLGRGIARMRSAIEGGVVWEVGCGSGLLAALCGKMGAREVWATDVDEEALALAAKTAELNGVRVRVARASLLSMDANVRPDVVIANLPQKPVPTGLDVPIANDGGPEGTRLLLPFLDQAAERMTRGGVLFLFYHSLAPRGVVRRKLEEAFTWTPLCGRDRVFYADEFAGLLPYWRERRERGLCEFEYLSPGRYSFECVALACIRR